MSVDWTQFPKELVDIISKKLTIYGDYLRFQAVCRTWRSSVPSIPTHLPPQLPWLMLPKSQSRLQPRRAFFDLSNHKVHILNLSEAASRKRSCGSSHGWLVLLDETPEVILLNPLSRAKLFLPPLSSFPNVIAFNYSHIGREYLLLLLSSGDRYTRNLRQMRDYFIKKVVLSSSPGMDTGFFALAILNQTGDLAYCRNGDNCWRLIEGLLSYCEDVIFFKGSFYAVDKYGTIMVCDLRGYTPKISIVETPRQLGGDMQYLVGLGDELLLVTRYLDLELDFEPSRQNLIFRTNRFEVFRLDASGLQWERILNLGDNMIFVGENSSLSFSASDFPGCTGNCVYYTDDYSYTNDGVFIEPDLGIYRLSDGSIEPLPCYPANSFYGLQWPPPIWITPNPC